MSPSLVIVPMIGPGIYIGVMWGIIPAAHQSPIACLQMVAVLEARQHWLGHNILGNVQFQPAQQSQHAAHITLVDVNFLEANVAGKDMRQCKDGALQIGIIRARSNLHPGQDVKPLRPQIETSFGGIPVKINCLISQVARLEPPHELI